MKAIPVACFTLLLACTSCVRTDSARVQAAWRKIQFDLTQLDKHGLRGSADSKVAVAYEFAIPNTAVCRAEVKRIDPSVKFMPESTGRIGATADQCLCVGSTYQKDHAKVLRTLAELPYVDLIAECFFE